MSMIEGEGKNKYQVLKDRKIRATKAYLESKGLLDRFPKDTDFWNKMVDFIDQQIRINNQ